MSERLSGACFSFTARFIQAQGTPTRQIWRLIRGVVPIALLPHSSVSPCMDPFRLAAGSARLAAPGCPSASRPATGVFAHWALIATAAAAPPGFYVNAPAKSHAARRGVRALRAAHEKPEQKKARGGNKKRTAPEQQIEQKKETKNNIRDPRYSRQDRGENKTN